MLDTMTDLRGMLSDPSLLETRAYIGGAWVEGDKGTFKVTNPARGDVLRRKRRKKAGRPRPAKNAAPFYAHGST